MNLIPSELDTVEKALRFAVQAVIEQGKPSLDPVSEACVYRAPDGCKCALGHLIPDDVYTPTMERKNALVVAPLLAGTYPWLSEEKNALMIRALQSAHDSAASRSNATNPFLQLFKFQVRWHIHMGRLPAALSDLVEE